MIFSEGGKYQELVKNILQKASDSVEYSRLNGSPSDANYRWYKQMQGLNHLQANTDDSDE